MLKKVYVCHDYYYELLALSGRELEASGEGEIREKLRAKGKQASLSVQVKIIDCRFLNRFSLVALLTRTRSMSETAFPGISDYLIHPLSLDSLSAVPISAAVPAFFSALQWEQNTNQKRQESVYKSIHRRHHTQNCMAWQFTDNQIGSASRCNRMLSSHQARFVLKPLNKSIISRQKRYEQILNVSECYELGNHEFGVFCSFHTRSSPTQKSAG